MPSISQIRISKPNITLRTDALFIVDQAPETVSVSMQEIKNFVRPELASSAVDGLMTANDKLKLDALTPGASQNQSDAVLLNRANHTGQQNIATVTGLSTALSDALNRANHTGQQTIGTITNLSSSLATLTSVVAGNSTAISALELDTDKSLSSKPTGKTRVISGLALTIDATKKKVEYASGKIVVVDNSDPSDPIGTYYTNTAGNLTVSGAASFSYVYAGSSGVSLSLVELTDDSKVLLGVALHSGVDITMIVTPSIAPVSPFPSYLLLDLPPASLYSGEMVEVSNAAGGVKLVRSDGTNWKILNTTTTVT